MKQLTPIQEAWITDLETTTKMRTHGKLCKLTPIPEDQRDWDSNPDEEPPAFTPTPLGFCCLGVFAAAHCVGTDDLDEGVVHYQNHHELLPTALWHKLGLHDDSGSFRDPVTGEHTAIAASEPNNNVVESLADLNDRLSLGLHPQFQYIAAFIRKHADKVFV